MTPSLDKSNILLAPDGFYLPATSLQSRGQLARNQFIYACMFGVNVSIVGTNVGKLEDFVSRI